MVLLRTSTMIGYYRHLFVIIATPTAPWGPLRGPRSTVRMVLSRTSAIMGYYEHLFARIATPTVLWGPLRGPRSTVRVVLLRHLSYSRLS